MIENNERMKLGVDEHGNTLEVILHGHAGKVVVRGRTRPAGVPMIDWLLQLDSIQFYADTTENKCYAMFESLVDVEDVRETLYGVGNGANEAVHNLAECLVGRTIIVDNTQYAIEAGVEIIKLT